MQKRKIQFFFEEMCNKKNSQYSKQIIKECQAKISKVEVKR
jgi:hypothetical protein